MLYYLSDKLGRNRKTAYNRAELNQLLSLYGEYVSKDQWRDYAIDSLQDMAIFSIYRHSHESPLFTIVKIRNKNILKPSHYVVYNGTITDNKIISRTSLLSDALTDLREKGLKK